MDTNIFIQSAIQQFKDYKLLAEKTFDQLEEKDFHFRPDTVNNSLCINITHMHGNMVSRWTNFLTEDGEKPWRQRDAEFEAQNLNKEQLMKLWETGWETVLHTLASLKPEDLDKTIHIRTKPLKVIEAVHRQLTHYAYHVGQIVFLGKLICGDRWVSLSIQKGASQDFNNAMKNPS